MKEQNTNPTIKSNKEINKSVAALVSHFESQMTGAPIHTKNLFVRNMLTELMSSIANAVPEFADVLDGSLKTIKEKSLVS